jgi:hypothetical protein
MDEVLQNLASLGLGNLSPAQLASMLGPEKMAALEQMGRSLRSPRDQRPDSPTFPISRLDNEELFIQTHQQAINRAKEAVEVSLAATTAPDEG